MMSGEKDSGDSLRDRLYPPQPEPRMMTRSRLVSDWGMAVECPTWAARYRVLVENRLWICLAWVRHSGLPRGRTALSASSFIAIAIACRVE